MIRAIAIDDEPLALKVIQSFCDKVEYLSLEKVFTQPSDGLKHVRKYPVDLIFLDIKMPSMTGIKLAEAIEQNTMVIFTTAFTEYAAKSYELKTIDYLLKPISFERFQIAATKAFEYYNFLHQKSGVPSRYLFFRADYSLVKVSLDDIELIEGLGDYLKISITGKKPLLARMSMKVMLDKLPQQDFIRIHRSYIIPFKSIESVRNNTVKLLQKEIPIGRTYIEEFYSRFK